MTEKGAAPPRFTQLGPQHEAALADLFSALVARGEDASFHPHPLSASEASTRARYAGKDLYFVAVDAERVLGYAMLRGWDEGYEVPSLGIALHPAARGRGLGREFMLYLHDAARQRGAKRVRLKVYPENTAAVRLYASLGYDFGARENGQLVGHVDL